MDLCLGFKLSLQLDLIMQLYDILFVYAREIHIAY